MCPMNKDNSPIQTQEDYALKDMEARSGDIYAFIKYEILLSWIRSQKASKILVAGCGSGELCHMLALKGHSVIGVDPGEKYIALAQQQAQELKLTHYKFLVSTIENYTPESSEKFDMVIATDVIEHIEDDTTAVKKMLSLLKPEGLLLITVPEGQWLFGHHDIMLQHYRRYSKRTLKKLLTPYVQINKLRSYGFTLIPICLLFSRILKKEYPIPEPTGKKPGIQVIPLLLRLLLSIEKLIAFPLGTSLLLIAKPKK